MIDEIKTQLYVCNIVMHACKNYSSGIGCEIMVHWTLNDTQISVNYSGLQQ